MSKFVRRDKLADMQVYDRKGRFVGTVKDIGFIPGESTVGLVVTTKDRTEVEIHWSEVTSIEDIVLLEKDFNPTSVMDTVPIASIEEEKPLTPVQKVEMPQEIPMPKQEQTRRVKQCLKCYTENDPKYKYCHKCGAKLPAGP